MSSKARTAAETRALKKRLLHAIQNGASRIEAMELLDVAPSTFRFLLEEVKKDSLHAVDSQNAREVFAEYKILVDGMVQDLVDVIEDARMHPDGPQNSAIIAATRTKAQLLNDVIARGQELGLIHKEASKNAHLLFGGLAASDLSMNELAEQLTLAQGRVAALATAANASFAGEGDEDVFRADPTAPAQSWEGDREQTVVGIVGGTADKPPVRKKVQG